MTMSNPQQPAAPATSSLTIEGMADSLGIDGLFDATDTDDAGHPDDTSSEPQKKDPPVEEPETEGDEPEDKDTEEEQETEGDEPEETTDSDETPEGDASTLELEPTQVEQLFGLADGAVTSDDDGNLLIKTKIDGEQGTVQVSDLVESYQLKGHLTKQSQKFAEEKEQAQSYLQQQAQALSQQIDGAKALTDAMRERLVAVNNSVDWEKLRAEDPAEYAAKRQELGEQYRQIDGYLANINQQREQQTEEQQKEQNQQLSEHLVTQHQKLVQALPEWSDDAVMVKQMGDVKMFLISNGYTPEEISRFTDARMVLITRKAMLADSSTKKVSLAKKKVAAIPKIVKPGARTSEGQSNRTAKSKALKRQREHSSRDNDAAAFFALMGDDF